MIQMMRSLSLTAGEHRFCYRFRKGDYARVAAAIQDHQMDPRIRMTAAAGYVLARRLEEMERTEMIHELTKRTSVPTKLLAQGGSYQLERRNDDR